MRRVTSLPANSPARSAFPIGLAAGVVLLLALTSLPAPLAVPSQGSSLHPAISGACLGANAPTTATGSLVVVGSSTPAPAVSGVSVRVDYFYTEATTVGSQSNESCVPTSASNLSGGGGTIAVPLPLPPDRCVSGTCVDYLGPYGPLGYSTAGAPAGFFELDPTNGTSPGTIEWGADLYRAAINVTGTDVVSTNAPVFLSATAWNAIGTPATGALTYDWTLGGLGWTPSAQTGPDATVQGTDSGWTGSLNVTVHGTWGTTTESVESPSLSLFPVGTTVLTANATPNPVDPGAPVNFSVTGAGAAGYSYGLTVDPGAGTLPVSAPCESSAAASGTVNLTCQVRAAYLSAGNVTPTGTLSNGYSTATFSFLPVSVHPVEQVSLAATAFVTYPNRNVTLTVSVANGTGSAPYGPVCLAVTGAAHLTCETQNATSWKFNVSFPAPGDYSVRAYVADRFGENVSASAGFVVVPDLTARVNGSASLTVRINETQSLLAVVAGGALPIEATWNSSELSLAACSGIVLADGPVHCTFSAAAPGQANVTLTLRDALGSVAAVFYRITVTPAPAATPRSGGLSTSTWIALGALAAVAVAAVIVVPLVVRRGRNRFGAPVEETELERMARGRDYLLARADPGTPRRPDELVAGWTGPPVAAEEWAEWIAALVADGSLIPSRDVEHRLAYRRAASRPSTPTIQFDPTVWEAHRRGPDEEPDSPSDADDRQGGG